jgi:predicted enzyme related to lactoylglutathione lyase
MLGYFAIHVSDSDRARAFYTAVFGWAYETDGDYHHIAGSSPAGGIAGGYDQPRVVPSFVAEGVDAMPGAKRSESGWSATAEDGRGGSIEVWQPAEGYSEPNPKCAVGDLFYFVLPVADNDARQFYADLLGWRYTTGSHPGGFNIVNISPPGGVFVGAPGQPSVYFRVDDVDAAADRVRAAGGTAGPTEPNSAGWHAACQDDQGVEFSLGSVRAR